MKKHLYASLEKELLVAVILEQQKREKALDSFNASCVAKKPLSEDERLAGVGGEIEKMNSKEAQSNE